MENAANVARWMSGLTMLMTSETRRLAGIKSKRRFRRINLTHLPIARIAALLRCSGVAHSRGRFWALVMRESSLS